MAGTYKFRADPLLRKATDTGYRIGWKIKLGFQKGVLEGEMTYGEAKKKAEQMNEKEPDKVFWPEMIMDRNF